MSDFDPTTNRVPFGLLAPDEQTALIHWPHEWEVWYGYEGSDWGKTVDPLWDGETVYRGKPAPVVIKRWAAIYPHAKMGFWYDTIHDVMTVSGADTIGIIQLDITDGVPSTKILEVKK